MSGRSGPRQSALSSGPSAARAAGLAGLGAVVVAAAAVAGGWLAVLIGLPVAAGLGWVASGLRRGAMCAAPRRLVGLGAAAGAVGALVAAVGPAGLGWIAAAVGAWLVVSGARLALASEAVPAGASPLSGPAPGVVAAASLDLALTALWEVGAALRPTRDASRVAGELRDAVERLEARGWLARPELAHPAPPPLEKPLLDARRIRGAGEVEHLRFASEWEPADPEIAGGYLDRRANRTAHALLWRHRGGAPRPTLVSLHGFGMGRPDFDPSWLRLRGWDLEGLHRELGIDVAYVILPHHGPRGDGGPSGSGFFDGHPLATSAALGQAIWDLRRLAGWLRGQGVPALGVHGLSLGGCIAALFASLDGALACAIPMIPAVDLAALVWSQLPGPRRRQWREAGLGPELLARAWSIHAPLCHRPRAPFDARLVVAGLADRITPPAQAGALWKHWDRPAVHWFPGGHLWWRDRAGIRGAVEAHLRGTLLAEIPPSTPPLTRFR
jgi:hypothetical protein